MRLLRARRLGAADRRDRVGERGLPRPPPAVPGPQRLRATRAGSSGTAGRIPTRSSAMVDGLRGRGRPDRAAADRRHRAPARLAAGTGSARRVVRRLDPWDLRARRLAGGRRRARRPTARPARSATATGRAAGVRSASGRRASRPAMTRPTRAARHPGDEGRPGRRRGADRVVAPPRPARPRPRSWMATVGASRRRPDDPHDPAARRPPRQRRGRGLLRRARPRSGPSRRPRPAGGRPSSVRSGSAADADVRSPDRSAGREIFDFPGTAAIPDLPPEPPDVRPLPQPPRLATSTCASSRR